MIGRRPNLNEKVREDMVRELLSGRGLKAAAREVRLPRTTLFRWLARGREDSDGPYREFFDAVRDSILKRGEVA